MHARKILCTVIVPILCMSLLLLIIFSLKTRFNVSLWQVRDFNNLLSGNGQEWEPNLVCSIDEIQRQERIFKKLLRQTQTWTSCYSDEYLLQLYETDLSVPSNDNRILLFDIGANKGYVISIWLSLWMPELGIEPETLYNFIHTKFQLNDCGACNDCRDIGFIDLHIKQRPKKNVEIYAFEPQPETYRILREIQQWTNLSSFHVYNLGFSNQTGVAPFQACAKGAESCGLAMINKAINQKGYIEINITTLDHFIQKHQINRQIDVLKIDTEGFDPLVLQGADRLFSKQQVRLLIFEYHGVSMWSMITLESVLQYLDHKNYTCYQLGQTGILRLTGCWSRKFERKRWSNVLCVSRRDLRLMKSIEKLRI